MLLWIAILLAIVSVARGCGVEEPANTCHGRAAPVDEELLVSTLGRFGFDLEREDECFGQVGEPAAAFTNIPSDIFDLPVAGTIFASQSQVWCDLHEGSLWGGDVERARVGDEVVFNLLNAECRIYESNPWHVEWLQRAFDALRRAVP
jgi:hypothetical protein